MSLQPPDFRAPFITQAQVWQQADAFRAKYWTSGELPVDVMSIVEFNLDLEIIGIHHRNQRHGNP